MSCKISMAAERWAAGVMEAFAGEGSLSQSPS
jgi:hypothetical protein